MVLTRKRCGEHAATPFSDRTYAQSSYLPAIASLSLSMIDSLISTTWSK